MSLCDIGGAQWYMNIVIAKRFPAGVAMSDSRISIGHGIAMRIYTSLGTNSRIVDLFLGYKSISIEKVWIDISIKENRQPDFLKKNPLGQLPVLELDNGQCISQITAICEYLEELFPEPPLIGGTPEERAVSRMWLRRNDLLIIEPLVQAFKYSIGLTYYQALIHCRPHAVDDLHTIAIQGLEQLSESLESRPWVCGDHFTLADIQLYCFLAFASNNHQVNIAINAHLASWFDSVNSQLNIN